MEKINIHLGRDPLGKKERTKRNVQELLKKQQLKYINGISSKRKYLHEIKGMLDEDNILTSREITVNFYNFIFIIGKFYYIIIGKNIR